MNDVNRPTVPDAAKGATSPGEGSATPADSGPERDRPQPAHGDLERGRPIERSAVILSFWECGHVEVDDGSTHECDGRDVCVAKWHKYVPVEDYDELREALEMAVYRLLDALNA